MKRARTKTFAALLGLAFTGLTFGVLSACSGSKNDHPTGVEKPAVPPSVPVASTTPPPAAPSLLFESHTFGHEREHIAETQSVNAKAPDIPSQYVMQHMSLEKAKLLNEDLRGRSLLMRGLALSYHHVYPRVTVKTNRGKFVIELRPEGVPITTANFIELVRSHFYDGLKFHRFVRGYIIQGGDPKGTGTGGSGYRLLDEEGKERHEPGTVAMAKSSVPNSASSQFYIVLPPLRRSDPDYQDAHVLDRKYATFGRVVKGMDVVSRLRKGDRMISVTISSLPKQYFVYPLYAAGARPAPDSPDVLSPPWKRKK